MSDQKIYEVVDATDDEMYFLLGIFNTLEEIDIDENSQEPLTEHHTDDCETVEIRERGYGWCGDQYKVIKEINREQVVDEETDELVWRIAK